MNPDKFREILTHLTTIDHHQNPFFIGIKILYLIIKTEKNYIL